MLNTPAAEQLGRLRVHSVKQKQFWKLSETQNHPDAAEKHLCK